MDLAVETPARCSVYRRRRPERTPLYRAVQGHLETYLALAREGHNDGGRRAAVRGGGVSPLPRMRHPGPRLRPCPLRGVRTRFSDRLFLQRPRGVPLVQRTAHGRGGGASGGPGLPAAAGAPVGVVGAEAPALLPAARSRGARRGAAHLAAGDRGAAAPTQRLPARAAGGGELCAALWQRVECPCPLPLLRDRRGVRGGRGRAGPLRRGRPR